ncbi:MAG: hypothetical protein FJ221_09895 [Lentisphaerae bacterium]|nr:hypothetical protein [Lentisphaerota bacterium]
MKLSVVRLVALALTGVGFETEAAPPRNPVIPQLEVTRGICVVLGDARCDLALKLARKTELLVYMQLPDAAGAEGARRAVDEAGFYGSRVFVERGPLTKLLLADNVADALVATGDAGDMPEAEALRVLRPQGKALLGTKEVVKPFPAGVDDWSHPYHRADNNPASDDKIIRGPYLTQFLADPRYAPLPQVAVSSAGRVFKAFGHIAFKEREEPWLDTLAAFDGYNGTLLWRRPIPQALMVHRSTIVATPTTLYFGDDKSCKLYDAVTGELRDEIAVVEERTGGTFWKWMALEDGVLYALVGEPELRDPVIRARRETHGWPWNPLSPGFNSPENAWGYGRTLFAIDLTTKKVLWQHQEAEPMDSRALCMKNGRLFAFSFGSSLTCLDAKTGRPVWRKTKENATDLFDAIGSPLKRQDWRTNWRTTAYMRCSDKAVYFAGPQIGKLLAISAEDGRYLWHHPYDNYQVILQGNALYGIPGSIDQDPTRKFDALTGQVLAEIQVGRRACTRPTASGDAIFFRAGEGSARLDLAKNQPQMVSPMRAQCHDGVTIANGLLYWWPSTCDCNLSLLGITCLGPAGDHEFGKQAVESERLERHGESQPSRLSEDWPTFRANNTGTVTTSATMADQSRVAWKSQPETARTPTAPTMAGGMVFVAGDDGVVRALDAADGKPLWTAYTGGAIRFPPTIWAGRAFVASGDGWVYSFEAKTGRLLWRFRAAPAERRIPIYGQLLSTWPAASGVIVDDGVAYVAAGLTDYDGTHVFALDAATGRIKWQNSTSGILDPDMRAGVAVQGHMLLHDGKLYLAGGNAASPGVYDLATGQCLNDSAPLRATERNHMVGARAPRGWELYLVGNNVKVSGKPFYAHPQYPVYDVTVQSKTLVTSTADRDLLWINNSKLACLPRITESRNERLMQAWGKQVVPGAKPSWEHACKDSRAFALCQNAALIATATELTALDLQDGRTLWTQTLAAPPVSWGLAVNRDGCVIATLEGGSVVCFGR